MTNAISVKERLKKQAIEDGKTMQDKLVTYGLERTIRGTNFDDIAVFDDDFTKDETRQGRWRAFIKKKKALVKVEFEETMQLLKELLLPIVDSIHNNNSFEQTWSKETKRD